MVIEKNDWKNELIDALIEGFIDRGNTDLIKRVGYSYKYYAPKYIYKYYSDKPRNFESVKNQELWFSAPCNYNDVFDCEIFVDEKGIFDSICNSIPDERGVLPGSPMWHELKKQSRQSVKRLREILATIKETIGIACFSETDDSLLMWSHYANNHTGICVEYDMNEIIYKLKYAPVPVLYSDDRIVFKSLDTDSLYSDALRYFIRGTTTKSRDWSYEKEWRIVRDYFACGDKWDKTNNGALLDMIRPHSLILGCMTKEYMEKQAIAYCDELKINLYKMKKSEETYRLIKETIREYDSD